MNNTYRPHHIALSVSNLETSQAFYKLFGFTKAGGWRPADGSFEIRNLRNGDLMLELFCYTNQQPLPKHGQNLWQDLPVVGVKHFGLQVASIDDAKQSLQQQGLDILHEDINEDRSGANYFFVKDPDGILVEVIEDNRGI
jgi:glyoxylase I family protein